MRYVESSDFYGWAFFDSVGMMLLGMGLLKLGVLGAERSLRFYASMVMAGYGIGLPISAAASYALFRHRFDPVWVAWLTAAYDPGRVAVALGHVAVVMLAVKTNRARALTATLADVGRMALTNYLTATIICTTLFNGYGFGLFGSLRRHQLYLIVLAIWTAQMIFSRLWLRAVSVWTGRMAVAVADLLAATTAGHRAGPSGRGQGRSRRRSHSVRAMPRGGGVG